MAKKKEQHIDTQAFRYENEIFGGIKSTSLYPNQVRTQDCETPPMKQVPKPIEEKLVSFCYDFDKK